MAWSGNITHYRTITVDVGIDWYITSQSEANNTSTVYWGFYVYNDLFAAANIKEVDFTIYIDGVRYVVQEDDKRSIAKDSMYTYFTLNKTFTHNPDRTRSIAYSFEGSLKETGIKFNFSASGTAYLEATPERAHILTAPNFNDTNNPTITYTNRMGPAVESLQACISLTGAADNIAYRDIPKTGTLSYTFNLTDAERAILIDALPHGKTSMIVKFFIRTIYQGVTYHESVDRTFSLVDYQPTLSPTAKDVNARTKELTGNENIFIKHFSNVQFTTGAKAYKRASITSQYASSGGITIEAASGTFEGITSNTIYFGATDSRGLTVKSFLVKELIPYSKLTTHLTTGLLTPTGELECTISGKYFNGSFGAKANSMEVEYTAIDEDGEFVFNRGGSGWVQLGTVSPTISNGDDYTYSFTIEGLDHTKRYEIIVNVIDELTPIQSSSIVVAALPVFDWNGNDFHHHTDVALSNDKKIIGMTPDGDNIEALNPCNTAGDVVLGKGGYDANDGDTRIYGNNVYITPREKLIINGKEYGAQRVLWSGASHMNGGQVATLAQTISEQPNGIVLVFSLYRNGAADNVSISSFFVSKYEVAALSNAPHFFFMGINAGFSTIGAKYLYINDSVISGHEGNTSSGSNNGITFNNSSFVLRYVIGV